MEKTKDDNNVEKFTLPKVISFKTHSMVKKSVKVVFI